MTLTELIDEVYIITSRPDAVAKTLSAVQSATLKAHHSDFYHKDIFETQIDFGFAMYEPDFEFRTFIPRWRAAKYFRKYEDGVPGKFFDEISPENAMESYSQARTEVWYPGGEVIHLKSNTQIQYVLAGCYRHPDITVASYESWIALEHPWAIVYAAAQTIFRMTGKTEEAAAMKQEVAEHMILLRNSNILGSGE